MKGAVTCLELVWDVLRTTSVTVPEAVDGTLRHRRN